MFFLLCHSDRETRGRTQAEFPKMSLVEINRGQRSATESKVAMNMTEKVCLMNQSYVLAIKTLHPRQKVLEAIHTKELILFLIDFRAGQLYI